MCVCVCAVSKRWILSLNFEDFAKGKEDGVQKDCDKGWSEGASGKVGAL